MKQNEPNAICLTLEKNDVALFSQILQHGVEMEVTIGSSMHTLLCDDFGLSPEYIEGRIQTVFLNGSPVDNFKTAIVQDGDTLALSAAMPGLVGATMRRGGKLASFRSTISFNAENRTVSARTGNIILKLFNMMADELGSLILEKGIWIETSILKNILSALNTKCKKVEKDGIAVACDNLVGLIEGLKTNRLRFQVAWQD